MAIPEKWKKAFAKMGVGTIIFFTVKGIITTTLIVGTAWFGWKGCSS